MSFFSLFKFNKKTNNSQSLGEQSLVKSSPTEKESFESPDLLAAWVNQWWLVDMPLEENYSLLPDEDQIKSLNISYEQRERYVREITILRISGISMFVKLNYEYDFWMAFSSSLYPFLARYIYQGNYSVENIYELANVVEKYVEAGLSENQRGMSSLYMKRVYDDNDNYGALVISGVGLLSIDWLMGAYTIFRDAYCKVIHGMPYESVKLVIAALEEPSD